MKPEPEDEELREAERDLRYLMIIFVLWLLIAVMAAVKLMPQSDSDAPMPEIGNDYAP